MRDIHHFIDGASVAGASGRFGDIYDPNTGEVQARVGLATAGEETLRSAQVMLRASPSLTSCLNGRITISLNLASRRRTRGESATVCSKRIFHDHAGDGGNRVGRKC